MIGFHMEMLLAFIVFATIGIGIVLLADLVVNHEVESELRVRDDE